MSIKDEIEQVQKKIAELKEDLRIEDAVLKRLESISTKKRKSSRNNPTGPPRKGSLAAHIKAVLGDSERPLSVAEIIEGLKRRGFSSGAEVSLNNLIPSAITRRSDIFYRVRRGVYDLKSRQETGDGIIEE